MKKLSLKILFNHHLNQFKMIHFAKNIYSRYTSRINQSVRLPKRQSIAYYNCPGLLYPYHYHSFCTKKNPIRDSQQTFKLLIKNLQQRADYVHTLQKSMSQETQAFNNNSINKQQIRIQISQLSPMVALNDKIKASLQNLQDLQEMLKQTKDKQEKQMLQQQLVNTKEKLNEYKQQCLQLLVPPAPYDKADDIILQFRPGAGGAESSIFVQDISQMYDSFCSNQGWRWSISNAVKESGVTRGYKALDVRVQGPGCHKLLKCQAGVHKVIRVPETQSKGRLHSSTISVVVMPVVPFTFEVDPKDIKYQFTRSSGPGGQAVNKIQSACRATHIPTGLAVFIQQERSQEMNKKRATDLLKQKLFQLQYKKSIEQQQSKRKSQVSTMDRSQKIRTYNYPQDRITDHRTGLTKFGINQMMNGDMLEQFIDAYIESINNQRVNALILEMYQQQGLTPPKE